MSERVAGRRSWLLAAQRVRRARAGREPPPVRLRQNLPSAIPVDLTDLVLAGFVAVGRLGPEPF